MKIAACLLLAVLALRTAAGVLAADVQADALSAAQQRVLDSTLAEYAQPRQEAALDVERIKTIVADMHWASPPPDGVLKRLWRWFKRQLQAQDAEVDWLGWFEKWLRNLTMMPQSVAEWISRIAIAAMMAIVLVLIVNEVRRGSWRRTRSRRTRSRRTRSRRASALSAPSESQPEESALTWQAVASLPLQDRPGATLRLVLATLTAQGILATRSGHTHRQIAAEAVRSGSAGEPLAQLAKMAERARFDSRRLDAADGEQALTLGHSIVGTSASRS